MSTRAASSISSRRAKQKLVQLLFGPTHSRRGPDAHRRLDSSTYDYKILRSAYLERLQTIHPDKFVHKKRHHHKNYNDSTTNSEHNTTSPPKLNRCDYHAQFVELQNAWDNYEKVAKMMNRAFDQNEDKQADFTMFGVGCSFSDNPEERELRSKITDEACRGWFSSGFIPESLPTKSSGSNQAKQTSLCDDDMFVESTRELNGGMKNNDEDDSITKANRPKKSLVLQSLTGSRRFRR